MTTKNVEPSSVFLLKIAFFFIIGVVWLRFSTDRIGGIGIPIGFILGLIFAAHEHFQIDQKIEYVVLFFALVLSYILPIGAVILV